MAMAERNLDLVLKDLEAVCAHLVSDVKRSRVLLAEARLLVGDDSRRDESTGIIGGLEEAGDRRHHPLLHLFSIDLAYLLISGLQLDEEKFLKNKIVSQPTNRDMYLEILRFISKSTYKTTGGVLLYTAQVVDIKGCLFDYLKVHHEETARGIVAGIRLRAEVPLDKWIGANCPSEKKGQYQTKVLQLTSVPLSKIKGIDLTGRSTHLSYPLDTICRPHIELLRELELITSHRRKSYSKSARPTLRRVWGSIPNRYSSASRSAAGEAVATRA